INVNDRFPVRLCELDRAVDDVPDQHRSRRAAGDHYDRRPGRVARGVADVDARSERAVARKRLELRLQGRQLAHRRAISVATRDEVAPVFVVAAVGRRREDHDTLLGRPAYVIEVEVRQYHVGYVLGSNTESGETGEQLPSLVTVTIDWTEPRIDEHDSV